MFLDRIPIRFRLAVGHAILMALLFLCIGGGVYRLVEHQLYQSVDAALLTSAQSIRDVRFVRGFSSPLMQQFLEAFLYEKHIRPYAQLVDFSGRVSAKTANVRSLPVTPIAVSRAEHGLHTIETIGRRGEAPLRQVTIPVLVNGRFTGELVQVGASMSATQYTLRGISLMLWSALPAGLILSIIFGYFLTRRSLQPVASISTAASRLGIDDLNVRLKLPPAKDELRVLTQTFNEMLDRLEDAFARLRRFAGDVSHELRTPLAVLRAEAELALRRDRSSDEYRNALKVIVQEAGNMSGIVEDLLLLARAQSKAVAMQWEPIAVTDFLRDLSSSVKPTFDQRKVELRVDGATTGEMLGSAGYLALALKNLLLNAAKHSAAGNNVILSVREDEGGRLFTVKDFGEGIPEGSLPYIFDPFYRVDTARNRAAGGTGIGLSLALALVRLHNGVIRVESKVGQGATFAVWIPRPPSELLPPAKGSLPPRQLKSRTSSVEGRPAPQPS